MTVRPILDAIIPFLSWGLKRGEDGWKCYNETLNGARTREKKKKKLTLVPGGYIGDPIALERR